MIKTSHVMLGHLSRQNNIPSLAFETACSALKEKGIIANSDVSLHVAPCSKMSKVIRL
jgi:hypothetical protein